MPQPPRRTTTKLLRLHADELARITARARACGQTPARFIREAALGAIPKARQDAASLPLLHALARIAGSLEQLARQVNGKRGDAVTARLAAALDQHRALVKQFVADGSRGARQPTP